MPVSSPPLFFPIYVYVVVVVVLLALLQTLSTDIFGIGEGRKGHAGRPWPRNVWNAQLESETSPAATNIMYVQKRTESSLLLYVSTNIRHDS